MAIPGLGPSKVRNKSNPPQSKSLRRCSKCGCLLQPSEMSDFVCKECSKVRCEKCGRIFVPDKMSKDNVCRDCKKKVFICRICGFTRSYSVMSDISNVCRLCKSRNKL